MKIQEIKIVKQKFFVTVNFEQLNSKIRSVRYLPTVKLEDLESGKIYTITRLEEFDNSWKGKSMVIDLDSEFSLYLPKKVRDLLRGPEGAPLFEAIKTGVAARKVGWCFNENSDHQFVNL